MREVYPASVTSYLSNPVVMGKHARNPKIGAYRQEFATAQKNLKKLASAGVPITLGSGSGLIDTFPGFFEHRELELMVNAGMAPLDVINAATSASAAAIGATDLGTLAPGKKANFIVFASNPLEKIANSRDIDRVFVNGHDIDRLEMIRKIQVQRKTVSASDVAEDAAIRIKQQQDQEDAGLKKYGKYAQAPQSVNVTSGLIVPAPKRSKPQSSGAGPYRVTVSMPGERGADLQEFYSKLLPEARWTPAGDCWEKANPAQPGKKWKLCTEPGNGAIVLNISVQ